MKSIEEMEAELEANGYKWINNEYDFTHWLLNTPEKYTKFNDTEEAYRYLKQVQFIEVLERLQTEYYKLGTVMPMDGAFLYATEHSTEIDRIEREILQVVLKWKGDSDD